VFRVVFDNARGRRLMFTCFQPEVCVALRLKQSRYPVLFLTEGLPSPLSYGDVRCLTPQAAISHAKRESLLGFAPNAGVVLAAVDMMKAALNAGLRISTWGNPNNDPHNVRFQRELGIDMVRCSWCVADKPWCDGVACRLSRITLGITREAGLTRASRNS
jgi:glycerophosphoryl diester phosphodiesterase